MDKRKYHFAAISKAEFEHKEGAPNSTIVASNIRFEMSDNLDKRYYLEPDGMPKQSAIKPITITLLAGLEVNVRYGEEMGWWERKEHIEYIIEQLKKIGETPGNVGVSTMEY